MAAATASPTTTPYRNARHMAARMARSSAATVAGPAALMRRPRRVTRARPRARPGSASPARSRLRALGPGQHADDARQALGPFPPRRKRLELAIGELLEHMQVQMRRPRHLVPTRR